MAKHAHRLILIENKVWKCTLNNCSFFVYIGQQWVIEGKHVECWKCNETFVMSKRALKDEMPICDECRNPFAGTEITDVDDLISRLSKAAQTEIESTEKDEIEVIEPNENEMTDHTPACAAYFNPNDKCTCGYK